MDRMDGMDRIYWTYEAMGLQRPFPERGHDETVPTLRFVQPANRKTQLLRRLHPTYFAAD
jgi:hypothetical protein